MASAVVIIVVTAVREVGLWIGIVVS